MVYEREHRVDDLALASPAEELERTANDFDAPGKQTLLDRLPHAHGRVAQSLDPWKFHARGGPGRHATIAPRPSFGDFQALALRDVLSRIDVQRLQNAALAAADPLVGRRVAKQMRRVAERAAVSAAGRGLWRAAERRAVTLYRRALATGGATLETPAVTAALRSIGSGAPLDSRVCQKMEAILGVRLDRVRIHTGSVARDAAAAANAEAFTVGEDIFLPSYDPESPECQKLLLHELVHCCQWWQGRIGASATRMAVSQPGDALEQEAETVVAHAFRQPARIVRADAPGTSEISTEREAHFVRPPDVGGCHAPKGSPPCENGAGRAPNARPDAAIGPVIPAAVYGGLASTNSGPQLLLRKAKADAGSPSEASTDSDIFQRLTDLRRSASVTRAQINEVGGEYVEFLADNWELILSVIALFATIEWGSATLAAAKNYRAAAIGRTLLFAFDAVGFAISLDDVKTHAGNAWDLAWDAKGDDGRIYEAGLEWVRMAGSLVMACVAAGASLRNLLKGLKLFVAFRAARARVGTRVSHAEDPTAGDVPMVWNEHRGLFEQEGRASTTTPVAQTRTLPATGIASMEAMPDTVFVPVGTALGNSSLAPDDQPFGFPAPDQKKQRTPRNPNAVLRYRDGDKDGEIARVNGLGKANNEFALRNLGNGPPGYTNVVFHGQPLVVGRFRRSSSAGDSVAQTHGLRADGVQSQPSDRSSTPTQTGIEHWSAEYLARVLTRMGVTGPIRLLSCLTGATLYGFAARLASELKVTVLAHPEVLDINAIPEHGWFRFEPNGERSLLLQTWKDRSSLAYFVRFIRPLVTAPHRIVLNATADGRPAVRAASYQEDMRILRNLVAGDLGLFVEQHGRRLVILQRAPHSGQPLVAPPGTRELYRVAVGYEPPKVDARADAEIKRLLSAATASGRYRARRNAAQESDPPLRFRADTNAAASELRQRFKQHMELGALQRPAARPQFLADIHLLLLEIGLSESTWPALSKLGDEKLRALVEANDFLAGIAATDRARHAIVEWIAYAFACDRLTPTDYYYHLGKAAQLAALPEVVLVPENPLLLSAKPHIDGSTVVFEAREGKKDTVILVSLGSPGRGDAVPSPTTAVKRGRRIRYFDLNLRIWLEGHEVDTSALPFQRREVATLSQTDRAATLSASPREPIIEAAQNRMEAFWAEYFGDPNQGARTTLLANLDRVLTSLRVSPSLRGKLPNLGDEKLHTLLGGQSLLRLASSNTKVRGAAERVAQALINDLLGPEDYSIYMSKVEKVSQLREARHLVPFTANSRQEWQMFSGTLPRGRVLVQVPRSPKDHDLVEKDWGPDWHERVAVMDATLGFLREGVAVTLGNSMANSPSRDVSSQAMQDRPQPRTSSPSKAAIANAKQELDKAFRGYLAHPNHTELLASVNDVLRGELRIADSVWACLHDLHPQKLAMALQAKGFLEAATSSSELVVRQAEQLTNHFSAGELGMLMFEYYLGRIGAVLELPEVAELVPFGRGRDGTLHYLGKLDGQDAFVKLPKRLDDDHVIDGDLRALSTMMLRSGPNWGAPRWYVLARTYDSRYAIWREVVAMETFRDGVSIGELVVMMRNHQELPFLVTPQHVAAVRDRETRFANEHVEPWDGHAWNNLLRPLGTQDGRLLVSVDTTVVPPINSSPSGDGHQRNILSMTQELAAYSARHSNKGPGKR